MVFNLKLETMKQNGFAHVDMMTLSNKNDLHYPNMKTEWFEKRVIPFLDDAVAAEAKAPKLPVAADPGTLSSPTTKPAVASADSIAPVKTGEIDLTFTERSPISNPREMARRLNLKPADVASDYDLSTLPYKAYVPVNYDRATPVGIFVYLGYKNTTNTPPEWRPVLDKNHLIFISPVCHAGNAYPPAVPMWQALGMAMDAVHNLRKRYAIDDKRLYLMSWDEGSTLMAMASSDVFTGFVVTFDPQYCVKMTLPDGRFYEPKFAAPPGPLYKQSLRHGIFLISDPSPDMQAAYNLKLATMKRNGFAHLEMTPLSNMDDLHFPNFKAEWFEKTVLPFLDDAVIAEAAMTKPASAAPAASAEPDPNGPASLLLRAQLLLSNGQKELGIAKLKQIVENFPDDPAAVKAKQLLQDLDGQ
jgi:hypothetical protein